MLVFVTNILHTELSKIVDHLRPPQKVIVRIPVMQGQEDWYLSYRGERANYRQHVSKPPNTFLGR